jgi:hypothetical protein
MAIEPCPHRAWGVSLRRTQWRIDGQRRAEVRATRPEKKNLRGGLEGGENTTGLGDLKLGR